MNSVREAVRNILRKEYPLSPGSYSYIAPPEDPLNYRLHLRIEPGGKGILVVNAATILHLNQTATEFAYHIVNRTPLDTAVRQLSRRYRAPREQIQFDYDQFIQRIQTLVETSDLDPEAFLDFEHTLPNPQEITAPYRLDCALTYLLPEGVDSTFAPTKRVDRELSTHEWKTILDIAWNAGIPHVIFTGGEPTLRSDLTELISHAESNGQVTGLLSDGMSLSDANYLEDLIKTGLDHLLVVFQPEKELSWGGLSSSLAEDLFVAAHLTLTSKTADNAIAMLDYLKNQGLKGISLSANDPSLSAQLLAARNHVADLDLTLIWDLPVPYSAMNPIALEVQEESVPSGAGRAWLYIEPDGDVLPAQGINRVLGNILRDPWDQIWSNTRTQP